MEVIGGVRTPRTYLEYQKWADGMVIVPGFDPNGVDVPATLLEAMALSPERVRIRDSCWTATQLLYTACLEKDTRGEGWGVDSVTEVMVMFARDPSDGHVIVAAPRQVVGGARVVTDITKGLVNLVTGEEYKVWPPDGFISFGDSHSHNRMGAFFSGTDDADELSKPGFHIVAGEYAKVKGEWNYKLALSIVAGGKRYRKKLDLETMTAADMEIEDFIDMTWRPDVALAPKVWEYVSTGYPKGWSDGDTFGRKKPTPYELVPHGGSRYLDAGWGDDYSNWPTRTESPVDYESLYREHARREAEVANPFQTTDPRLADECVEEVLTDLENERLGVRVDAPGQMLMFPGATGTKKASKAAAWEKKYLRMEIDAMWDAMQRVLQLCHDDPHKGKRLLAAACNYTGYFKTVKVRRPKSKKGGTPS